MHRESIIEVLNLPVGFGYVLLVLGLILALAPWLQGSDFGILKIPEFSQRGRRALIVLGPLALAGTVVLHVPLIDAARLASTNDPSGSGLSTETPTPGGTANAASQSSIPVGDVQSTTLEPQSEVLADWKEDGCLYPARVIRVEGGVARLELGFGDQANSPPLATYLPKPAQFEHGARVWVKHERAWTPGTIRTLRDGRALVDYDTDSHCVGFLKDTSLWTDVENLHLPQKIGLHP